MSSNAVRDTKIALAIQRHPELSYTDIGKQFGVSASLVAKVAKWYDIRRPRGYNQYHYGKQKAKTQGGQSARYVARKRAPKCFKCSILTEKIEEGVAIVRVGKAHKRACQDCVERFDLEVVCWEREPVEWAKEEAPHCFDIARASWPAELLEVA